MDYEDISELTSELIESLSDKELKIFYKIIRCYDHELNTSNELRNACIEKYENAVNSYEEKISEIEYLKLIIKVKVHSEQVVLH